VPDPDAPDPIPAGTPADPVRPATPDDDAGASASASAAEAAARARARADRAAPGLREQIAATRAAVMGLLRAHIDLAKAELAEIKGEVARAAALGAVAFACVVLLGFLVPIGLILFIGVALFGSIGWGLLHGTLLLVGGAVAAILAALRVPGIGRAFLLALLVGVATAIFFGPEMGTRFWTWLGESVGLPVDPDLLPLAMAVLVLALIGAVVGLIMGVRSGGAGPAFGGLIVGAVVGALLGVLSAVTVGWQVGIALGVAATLLAWTVFMAVFASRSGIDEEALKARFWPQMTIDTTRETIEWAKERSPLGPKS